MRTTYLLPCTCGNQLTVDASQAGLALGCRCGATLKVPTLRGLASLERAPPAAAAGSQRVWGPRQAVIFLGITLALVGLVAAAALWLTTPKFPEWEIDRPMLQAAVESVPAGQLLDLWQAVSQDLEPGFDPEIVAYEQAAATTGIRLRIAAGACVAGLLVAAAGLLIPRTRSA